ncbi:MAG: transketolase family protein [Clostridia bacterium]|nr:transketolase family protein [Clostridia bacterium]
MAERKATRDGFGAALAELGEKYDFLVLDADLAAATKTGMFKKKFPDRFFDCGIAEGNMMGVAAGLAATGKKVFAASFAMFSAGRSYEQIRNSIGYPHLNVNIVGTHASITVGEDGATHQCNEDLALMRNIPGMTVICPADATEAFAAVEAVLNHDGPCYLRFGRYPVPNLTPELLPDYKFEIGKGIVYREGSDVTIVANGYMVHLALEAADILKSEGISAEVINIHTFKPFDAELVVASAKKTGAIVTAEEHSIKGGLGSAACEAVCEKYPVPVLRVGVEDKFGRSGQVPELLELYGLTAENIAAKARFAISMKSSK